MSQPSILIIDDEADSGSFIVDAATIMGMRACATTRASEFLEKLTEDTSLLFLDLVMPEVDGIELLRILGERQCRADIVLMSGLEKRVIETAEQWAMSLGLHVVARLHKPFRLADLEHIFYRQKATTSAIRPQRTPQLASEEEVCRAIREDEFVLHYQPQVDLATREVVGVEALVRWQHPTRGLIFPDDFISRVEELKLIDDLSWIVIRKGLREIPRFTSHTGRPIALSINISAYSLHDLRFPDTVLKLMRDQNMPTARTIFEITESGLIQELTHTLDVLTRLRMKGFQLSIDDFGTGYSMMQQLRRIPATELKIDRGFVQTMLSNDSDRVMVHKTIEIGHELNMRVIAEGVETAEQLDLLQQMKCDIAQGYYFSKPLPPDDLVQWLQSPVRLPDLSSSSIQ
ncbi:MAG: EAL domain-containing response regulator [Acidobacteriota bacterium]|nr:EAL domain-containing response regulator [Acidobacteriota bacterium]